MRITFNTKITVLCLWMSVIFLLSQQNGQDSSETSGILLELLKLLGIGPGSSVQGVLSHLVRKAGHFSEYLILAILFLRYRKAGNHREDPLSMRCCSYFCMPALTSSTSPSFQEEVRPSLMY